MQTISINFIVPQGWHELSDKQLRYVYQLLAQNFTSDEVKTLCLLHWTGTKVIGKQNTDGYLLRKGRFLFEVTPLTLAELLPNPRLARLAPDFSNSPRKTQTPPRHRRRLRRGAI